METNDMFWMIIWFISSLTTSVKLYGILRYFKRLSSCFMIHMVKAVENCSIFFTKSFTFEQLTFSLLTSSSLTSFCNYSISLNNNLVIASSETYYLLNYFIMSEHSWVFLALRFIRLNTFDEPGFRMCYLWSSFIFFMIVLVYVLTTTIWLLMSAVFTNMFFPLVLIKIGKRE